MEALVSAVVSVLINLISNDLSDYQKNAITKLRLRRLRKKISRWCTKYILSHDGTVLTEGRFAHYVEYNNPVSELYYYSQAPGVDLSEEEFLSYMMKKAQNDIEGTLNVNDQVEIKRFFREVLKQLNGFWISMLSTSEKAMLHSNAVNTNKVLSLVSEMGNDIKKSISNHFSNSELSEKDALAIFHALNDKFWDGRFGEIIDFYPAIEGKSKDLVLWIKLCLNLAMGKSPFVINFTDYQNIETNEIHDDIIRKNIIFSLLKDNVDCLMQDAYQTILNEIAENIKNRDFSKIYSQCIENRNHTSFVRIKLNDYYESEMWLTKRLLVIHLINQPLQMTSDSMLQILGNEFDYLMDLVITKLKMEELFQYDKDAVPENSDIFDRMWNKRNIYTISCYVVQDLFWSLCINAAINSDKSKLSLVINEIPEMIRGRMAIRESVYMAQIELGSADYEDMLKFCIEAGKYWLINNYYVSLDSPETVVNLIEKNKQYLLNDAMIFFVYVRALHCTNKVDTEKEILTEYESKYSDYIEFWISKIDVENCENDVNRLEELWMAGKVKFYSHIAENTIAEIFFKWKKYDTCIEVVKSLEERELASKHDEKLKAVSFNEQGRKLDALNTLKNIFSEEDLDQFVVNNIIIYSLDLKRNIDTKVVKAAIKINTSYSLMLVAKICERESKHDEARKWYMRSLILNKDNNELIYGNFWYDSVQNVTNAEMNISVVAEETTVYIKDSKTGNVEVYCICPNAFLPEDPYYWNNTVHISTESAIRYGLLRKKVGENIVLNGKEYSVEEIIPLECFYDRFCMTKMIQGGHAKGCQVPITDDKESNFNYFTNWLKENTSNDDSKYTVFQEYKDFTKIPLTFYSLSRYTRMCYAQFVVGLLEDGGTIVREQYFNRNEGEKNEAGYVLSFSATILLFMLGVNPELLRKVNACVPKSLVVELKDEKETVIKEYNRETVASIGVVEGKLFFNQAGEDEKSKWMKLAVELLDYCEQIPQIDNVNSISVDMISEDDILMLYGVVDYDAVSICKDKCLTLVSVEMVLSELASMSEFQIKSCNALEFIRGLELTKEEILKCVIKMVRYRLINVISAELLYDIVTADSDNTESMLFSTWNDLLVEIDKTRGEYRDIMQREHTLAGKKVLEKDTLIGNLFMRIYSSLVMKLNSLKYTYRFNDNGELEIGTVYEPYEDVGE